MEQLRFYACCVITSSHSASLAATGNIGALITIIKWAPQLSVEIGLPDWIEDELREILIFEIIKTYLCQPFNRYAWFMLQVFGHEFHYHCPRSEDLSHIFSIIAKIVLLNPDVDRDFWANNMEFLLFGTLELLQELPDC
ncbi:hypothetical protein FPANT_12196 [Fusarium pseudoanthophilum]|uniref:Uncharacterized protein n=1 Tax=Fusarium pseudoanthophilum TaxID=48495 RepID=A0A8H5KKR6_9HYPO|nr:hypothetical protein FPANT_12196 [Fusarium pseudoanthophilum]